MVSLIKSHLSVGMRNGANRGVVGVVGSGRGITQYERMGKHKFEADKEE